MQYEKAIVIQTILFLSGINTLLQVHFGTRLPAVMSGSYTYIYPAVAIILSPRYALVIDPLEVRSATARSRFTKDPLVFLQSPQLLIDSIGVACLEVHLHDEVAPGRAHHRRRLPGRRRLLRHMESLHKVSLLLLLY
jgi:hypothetical protein